MWLFGFLWDYCMCNSQGRGVKSGKLRGVNGFYLIVGRPCARLRAPPLVGESKVSGESKMSGSPYNLLLKDGQLATNCYQLYYIIEDILFYFMLIKFAFSAIKSKLAIDYKYSFLSLLALLLPPSSLKLPTSIITNILPL
jgi:hypothetical protein